MTDILGRIGSILPTSLDETLDDTADPGALLDQLFRDYADVIREAEGAVGQILGELRMTEDDLRNAQGEVDAWGTNAGVAAERGSHAAISGNPSDVARFDELAKAALRQQIVHETRAAALQDRVTHQALQMNQLRAALEGMHAKVDELKSKNDELAAWARMTEAQHRVRESIASISSLDPARALGRSADRAPGEEAPAADGAEVERRLASLKGGSAALAAPR